MEFLNLRKLPVSILLLILPLTGFSQQDIIRAFAESYPAEADGQYKEAINTLEEVYQPDSYELNLRLGWLYYLAGALEQSSAYYKKAISLKPYAVEPRLGIAQPLSAMGKWDEVLAEYHQILKVDPQNSLTNYRTGLIYYNRAEYERAEPYLEKVVNLYPFDYDSLLLFAWIKLRLAKVREATVLFNKVLMYNPGDESALEGLNMLQ